MSHPLDLLGHEKSIDTLFIDARSLWLQAMPYEVLEELQSKYTVCLYYSERMPDRRSLEKYPNLLLISKEINMNFISGYIAAREKVFLSRQAYSQMRYV